MFKRSLRTVIDKTAFFTGVLSFFESKMRNGITILMYHRILPFEDAKKYPLDSLVVPSEVFELQIKYLSELYTVLPINEAFSFSAEIETNKKPIVCITFDDGYWDNSIIAAPILEKYGVKGTFFITSDFVKTKRMQWYDVAAIAWGKLNENDKRYYFSLLNCTSFDNSNIKFWMEKLKRTNVESRKKILERLIKFTNDDEKKLYSPMSSDQIKLLSNKGHEIGAHSKTHPILTQLSIEELRSEIFDSKNQLNEWIQKDVVGFCYPNGDNNELVRKECINAGFQYACTTKEGINFISSNKMQLQRIPITMYRVMRNNEADIVGFRSELCRFRSLFR